MNIMNLEERKERLSVLARTTDFHRQFHASDAITAIDTLNKIDGIYKQQVEVTHAIVHTFIFALPDGTRFTPGLLPQQASTLHNNNSANQDIVEYDLIDPPPEGDGDILKKA